MAPCDHVKKPRSRGKQRGYKNLNMIQRQEMICCKRNPEQDTSGKWWRSARPQKKKKRRRNVEMWCVYFLNRLKKKIEAESQSGGPGIRITIKNARYERGKLETKRKDEKELRVAKKKQQNHQRALIYTLSILHLYSIYTQPILHLCTAYASAMALLSTRYPSTMKHLSWSYGGAMKKVENS